MILQFNMGRSGSSIQGKRFLCPIKGCDRFNKNKDELRLRHIPVCDFRLLQSWTRSFWDPQKLNALTPAEETAFKNGTHTLEFPQYEKPVVALPPAPVMDSTAGRGQREKKPSEKVKELTGKKPDTEDPNRVYPPVYTADHVLISADVKEVEKIYQHTKITATGQKYDFYALGNQ